MTERIVAVALRIQLPLVATNIENEPMVFAKPRPARHYHLIHSVALLTGQPVLPDEQGFLTSEGRYVDRDEGMMIAKSANQVDVGIGDRHLFSEDLW